MISFFSFAPYQAKAPRFYCSEETKHSTYNDRVRMSRYRFSLPAIWAYPHWQKIVYLDKFSVTTLSTALL